MFTSLKAALVATTFLAPATIAVAQSIPESGDPIKVVERLDRSVYLGKDRR